MSTDINQVVLVGRLTREAELKYTNSGTAVSNFSIACNEAVKQQDGSWQEQGHFFDLTMWGKQAESLQQYLTKGRQVAVTGRLKQQTWTDQTSGQNRSKVVVNVQNLELLAAPGNAQGGNSSGSSGYNDGGYPDVPPNRVQGASGQPYPQNGAPSYRQPSRPPAQGNLYAPQQSAFDPPAGPKGYDFPGPEQFQDDIPF
jgi:single-strand DNA-binding protein